LNVRLTPIGGAHCVALLSTKNILFVEDNTINQKVGMRMLQALGCRAKLAGNGEECLEAIRNTLSTRVARNPSITGICVGHKHQGEARVHS
jgi:hypothetical protein